MWREYTTAPAGNGGQMQRQPKASYTGAAPRTIRSSSTTLVLYTRYPRKSRRHRDRLLFQVRGESFCVSCVKQRERRGLPFLA